MEYWITGCGVEAADGDIGDWNHEAIAQQRILDELGYDLDTDSEAFTYEEAKIRFGEYLDNYEDDSHENFYNFGLYMHRHIDADWHTRVRLEDYLYYLQIEDDTETISEQAWEEGTDSISCSLNDARAHAIQHWGWIRYMDTNFETWTLTPDVCETIVDAIQEIWGDDEGYVEQTFNIEIVSLGKTFEVSYADLESYDICKRLTLPEDPMVTRPREPLAESPMEFKFYPHPGD